MKNSQFIIKLEINLTNKNNRLSIIIIEYGVLFADQLCAFNIYILEKLINFITHKHDYIILMLVNTWKYTEIIDAWNLYNKTNENSSFQFPLISWFCFFFLFLLFVISKCYEYFTTILTKSKFIIKIVNVSTHLMTDSKLYLILFSLNLNSSFRQAHTVKPINPCDFHHFVFFFWIKFA